MATLGGAIFKVVQATNNTIWFHWVGGRLNTQFSTNIFFDFNVQVLAENGNTLFRTDNLGNNNAFYRLGYRDGGAIVNTGSMPMGGLASNNYDLRITVDNAGNGSIAWYVNETLIIERTGLSNGTSVPRTIMWQAGTQRAGLNSDVHQQRVVSEILLGIGPDSPTLGRRVYNQAPSADSATNNAWTNGQTEVAKDTVITNGEGISSTVVGQRQGFTAPAVPFTAIETVAIQAFGQIGTTGPGDYAPTVRINGTDYDQAGYGATGIYGQNTQRIDLDPDSGNNWTKTVFDATEFGVVSLV
jgi:hypothetical protein